MSLTKMFEHLELKKKLLIGFAIPLALLAIIATTVYFSLERLLLTSHWVNHTYQAIALGDGITRSLINMETGLRGFLVAGKDEFLEPYNAGQKDFAELIKKTQIKVADNPDQVKRLQKVEVIKNEWIKNHVEPAIAYRREVNEGDAAAQHFKTISARIVGKKKFDGFRQFLGEIKQEFERSNDPLGLSLVDKILIDMINQETGQRGYLLTGKEESLEPFLQGIASLKQNIERMQQLINFRYNDALKEKLSQLVSMTTDWRTEAAEPEIEARRAMNAVTRTLGDVTAFIEQGIGKQYMDEMRVILNDFISEESALILDRNEDQQATADFTRTFTIAAAIISLIIGYLMAILFTRIILRQLGADPLVLKKVTEDITAGDLSNKIDPDEAKGVLLSIGNMQSQLAEAAHIIETDVQVLVNSAKSGDLSQRINLDDKKGFYRSLSENLNQLITVNEQVVNDTSMMFAAMANGDLNTRIETHYQGSFNQLKEDANLAADKITDIVEGEIKGLIDQARQGDLSQRIELSNKTGFFKALSDNINKLVETNESVVNDTLTMFGAMAKGDLSVIIDTDYHGSFETLKKDANLTAQKLTQVIEGDIQNLVNAARSGDLTQRIDLSNKEGFFRSLSEDINDLIEVNEKVLNDSSRVMAAMAEGDLTHNITTDYQGAFDSLKNDTNDTLAKLIDTIATIRKSADSVSSGSDEIAAGNKDLSERTEQQASTLEETSASMQDITSSVRESASNARAASDQANLARKHAQEGGQVVQEAIASMSQIVDASNKINNIIGAIDDIAFQTNLLALNAAVEAARAGEQGKGFAVVAVEVRNLSQRSASAAKEIKDLIQDSVIKAESGSTLVNASGEKLTAIVAAVETVADMIDKVDKATANQTNSFEQINEAIHSMETITQQNAALVEQAAASSESMSVQTNDMGQLLGFFNTGNVSAKTVNQNPKTDITTRQQTAPIKKPTTAAKDIDNSKVAAIGKAVKQKQSTAANQDTCSTPASPKKHALNTNAGFIPPSTDDDSDWDAF